MESIIWFLVIGGLFYFMMRYGCGAHMGGHGGHGENHEGHAGHGERPPIVSQKVKDPVCGMEIDRDQAHTMVRRGDRQVFFCSEACHTKFNEEPEKYL
jgi:YHS domain-containing protein